jgi:phage gp46-like protein
MKAEYEQLRANYEAIGLTSEELREELLQAAAYLGILNSLQISEPGYWHGLLSDLSAAVPKGIRITQLTLDDSVMQLRGTAADDGDAALFWIQLDACSRICTVRFDRIQYGEGITFEMRITLQKSCGMEVDHETQ